jgi:hypothetical protein
LSTVRRNSLSRSIWGSYAPNPAIVLALPSRRLFICKWNISVNCGARRAKQLPLEQAPSFHRSGRRRPTKNELSNLERTKDNISEEGWVNFPTGRRTSGKVEAEDAAAGAEHEQARAVNLSHGIREGDFTPNEDITPSDDRLLIRQPQRAMAKGQGCVARRTPGPEGLHGHAMLAYAAAAARVGGIKLLLKGYQCSCGAWRTYR